MTEESEEYEGRESLQGWVKMHRRYANEPVFQDENLWRLFSWLLLYARHTPGPVGMASGRGGKRLIRLEAGQLVTGRKKLASVLGWPESSVKNRLQKLQDLGVISVEVDSQFSIVTVTNFQGEQFIPPVEKDSQRTAKGQPKDNQRPTKGQPKDNQRTQRKNVQNVLNEKNDTREGESSDSVDAHSLDENPTSVSQVTEVLKKRIQHSGTKDDPSLAIEFNQHAEFFREYKIIEASIPYSRAKLKGNEDWENQVLTLWIDYQNKTQTTDFPVAYESETEVLKAMERLEWLKGEMIPLVRAIEQAESDGRSIRQSISDNQLKVIANTFFGYWATSNWKRKGKPVNWKAELDLWLWREIEKIQKADKNRKPVVDPYANCPKY